MYVLVLNFVFVSSYGNLHKETERMLEGKATCKRSIEVVCV